jgi:hypothetical protein
VSAPALNTLIPKVPNNARREAGVQMSGESKRQYKPKTLEDIEQFLAQVAGKELARPAIRMSDDNEHRRVYIVTYNSWELLATGSLRRAIRHMLSLARSASLQSEKENVYGIIRKYKSPLLKRPGWDPGADVTGIVTVRVANHHIQVMRWPDQRWCKAVLSKTCKLGLI